MRLITQPKYRHLCDELLQIGRRFDQSGEMLVDGNRNTLKVFEVEGIDINVKSFKLPNFINSFAYRFIRKSKAQRSFEYGQALQSREFLTPDPIGYLEFHKPLSLSRSFYFSRQIETDFPFSALITNAELPDREVILRQFAKFTYELHEREILFLDHSPGNTLIKKTGPFDYDFYLVDLNRMQFKKVALSERWNNFSRLSATPEMLEIIADEYAGLIGLPFKEVFGALLKADEKFRSRKLKKKKLKTWVGM
nr:hypothetical protein [Saprospiraceae bacterium]